MIEVIDRSQIPIFTINVLQALPKTPLWDRLAREGRLITDPDQDSNVKFLRPRGKVLASWRRTIAYAYTPERLFARFRYQVDATYANRLRLPAKGKLTKAEPEARRCARLEYRLADRDLIGLPGGVLEERRGTRCAVAKSRRFLAWASSRGT